ncbi:MAG: M20/M25/M40 family metallo-hydrolase [Solirubrobacteraceae bacterium]
MTIALAAALRRGGLDPRILAQHPTRPNVLARVSGRGEAPPLLLYGHADVVPASDGWRHPPFSGALVHGEIWGRGTLDMKGGLGMLLSATLRAARTDTPPPGDLIFAATSGEETGGAEGAAFLVREHPELFSGVRHALSEFGGYTQHVGERRLYPIQVAQKGRCLIQVTTHGKGGHSATPRGRSATGRLAEVLRALERRRLPTHVTPSVRLMVLAMADGLPGVQARALRALLRPRLTNLVLTGAGAQAEDLQPLFRNTAVATIVRAGEATNTTPTQATATLDGRLVPGHEASELAGELGRILPTDAELEILEIDPPSRNQPNLELIELLSTVLREEDPAGHPFPLVTPGMTDARHFDRLGIQTYGFLPMRLPPGLLPDLLHARDERVPAAALTAGTAALGRVIERYR